MMSLFPIVLSSRVVLQTAMLVMMNTRYLEPEPTAFTPAPPLSSTETIQGDSTRCYGIYGCFSTDSPWTSETRPISLPPESPEKINPYFCLYTRRNRHECQRLELMRWNASYLNPRQNVVLISHGYLENGQKPWLMNMTRALLDHSDMNVIVIGWGGGSKPPYSQAVANIRVVGAMAGHLVAHMVNNVGVDVKKCHVIGHSLGSHVASYIGHTLQTKFRMKLGRITGLDPAEPHFTKTDPIVRLDPSDADYVDVVHTDAAPFMSGGLGLKEPVGHVDFYPNGGIRQPGCTDGVFGHIGRQKGSLSKGLRSFVSCNHLRSYEYYMESINTKYPFMAIECKSWEDFLNGSCFSCGKHYDIKNGYKNGESYCTRFGYNSQPHMVTNSKNRILQRRSVKTYLITGSETPFCREHFRVLINVSTSPASVKHGSEIGHFWIVLKRGESVERIQVNTRAILFEPGTQHKFIVSTKCSESLEGVSIEWVYETSFLNPLTWRFVTPPRLFLQSAVVENLERSSRHTLCPPYGRAIYPKEVMEMRRNLDCKQE
ncbi:pancreatic triacylglycerol lipase-like isoform X1 [Schistocerca gregaria]|uniref:pancreatic triacylglycerol lipase-like isoform X1 n=1 Tax=Schistocerca gregaria TaxID=7010 RepID=UPI00211E2CA1|nr:pancreatic triacylglycerol lipase-like isoform X1 [Schistocerca gregaria]